MTSTGDIDYLFVYNILRKSSGISCILSNSAIYIGDGIFKGKLYDAGFYPVAVPSEGDSDQVKGDVYALPDPESVLKTLDTFEGCRSGGSPKGEFHRDKATIYLQNGDAVKAWIYIYNRPIEGLKVIASGDYLKG